MQVKLTTTILINGRPFTHTGRLCKKTNMVINSKGVKCSIKDGDTLEEVKPKKRQKRERVECPLDMHQWFNKSKQISGKK